MDIFNVQSLITKKRIVTANDIDPTSSYLQVGVFQPGNKPSNSGNADAYPSYAIPISEIAVKSNKTIIVVDSKYGDDTAAVTAGVYDFNKPFQTIDAAIANAAYADTLWVLGGFHNTYSINEQLLDKGLTIYGWNCSISFDTAQTAAFAAELTIKGNATIYINANIDTMLAGYVNINIEATTVYSSAVLLLDNTSIDNPCYFTLKANYLEYVSDFFFTAGLTFNINIDVITLNRATVLENVGDFWIKNSGTGTVTTFTTVSRFNFGKATLDMLDGTSLIRIQDGSPINKFYLTGDITATNKLGIVTKATAIVIQDAAESFVEINANMNLTNVGAYTTFVSVSQAIIRGNILHDPTTNVDPFAACYYVDNGKVKLYADTRGRGKQLLIVPTGAPGNAEIDINNCKLINAGGIGNIVFATYSAVRIRIFNAKFIVDLANTYSAAASAPLPVEVYSLYDNVAMGTPNITNSLSAPVIGEMTDINMTDIGF
jgi:hypothetical protein